jgi:transposase
VLKIPDRGNCKVIVMNLFNPFRNIAHRYFKNALFVADKFHVLRLLNPAINRRRKEITGDRRTHPIRRLLLRNGKRLEYFERVEPKKVVHVSAKVFVSV